jgi:inhibitor of cysteine peptidase
MIASVEFSCDEFEKAHNGIITSPPIKVLLGGSVVVTLSSNGTTGFSWSESATISAPHVLQQTDHEYVAPEATGVVGAPGKELWTFSALKKGTSKVSMTYSQPWQGGQKNAWRFSVKVTVMPS